MITYDKGYPEKVVDVEPVSLLTEAEIASEILTEVNKDGNWIVAEMKALSKATGPQKKPVALVAAVRAQLHADLVALRAVDCLEYANATTFKAALDAAALLVPTSAWIAKLQTAYEVTGSTAAEKFADLKLKVAAERGV